MKFHVNKHFLVYEGGKRLRVTGNLWLIITFIWSVMHIWSTMVDTNISSFSHDNICSTRVWIALTFAFSSWIVYCCASKPWKLFSLHLPASKIAALLAHLVSGSSIPIFLQIPSSCRLFCKTTSLLLCFIIRLLYSSLFSSTKATNPNPAVPLVDGFYGVGWDFGKQPSFASLSYNFSSLFFL